MAKYKIGDTAWFAKYAMELLTLPCPVCFTKREVTLILGNGDEVKLPCNNCAPGYTPPSGYVKEFEYVCAAVPVYISGLVTETDSAGMETTEYRSRVAGEHGFYDMTYKEECLYPDEATAKTAAIELKVRAEREQETRSECIKKNNLKSFSWNAGYHLREAARNEKQMEYHRKMAVICRQRAKDTTAQA